MDEDSTSKEDDALNGWNDERAENEDACNEKQHILKKEQKLICGKAILEKIYHYSIFDPKKCTR